MILGKSLAEHSIKAKKLCEMATQTIALSSIFTSLDSNAYNQIPYADQFVPNNTTTVTPNAPNATEVSQDEQVVSNNNKINQQQHGQSSVAVAASNHIASSNPTTATVATTTSVTDTTATSSEVTTNGSRRAPVLQTNL